MRSCKQRVFLFLLAGVGSLCLAAPNPHVVLETNFGDITIELFPEKAPITVDNFLSYVNSGFYNGLLFHRSETRGRQTTDGSFIYTGSLDVVQGGFVYVDGPALKVRQPFFDPIINESYNGLSNMRGSISMARTTEPNSATAQFFLNHQDNIELDRNYPTGDGFGYCVYGQIADGLGVMDSLAQANIRVFPNLSNFFPDNPLAGMTSAYVLPCDTSHCAALSGGIRIGFEDFAIFASYWLDDCDSVDSFCNGADLDYSGGVDMTDLELFLWHWAQSVGYEPQFSDLVVNNAINLDDLQTLMEHWLDTGCDESNAYCGGADINRSGSVDLTDYSVLSNNWLESY